MSASLSMAIALFAGLAGAAFCQQVPRDTHLVDSPLRELRWSYDTGG
ncbi:MAG: hypothetical protein OEN01_08365 [Candidatus Krumholzibacteria bacterium]|nr:hypothetical protein [Candidatus Krumholzibacteria bacterium]